MKSKYRNSLFLSTITLALFASSAAHADTYYWDNTLPIEDAGFGTASGTWGSDSFWSLSSVGTDLTGIVSPLITDDLNFGTVGNALAAGTITVTGTQSANSLTFGADSGAIVLSGGTIDLAAAATINVNNAADTISSVLTGAGTSLTKTGNGILTISGVNTYAGETIISSGILKLGNLAALGAGTGAADGTTISSGATLDLGGVLIPNANANAERITVSGSGVGGNGAIISSTAIANPFIGVRFLTLAGDTTLGFANRWDVGHNALTGPSSLVGGGFTLNILGTGPAAQASFNNLGATDLGDINVNLGSVVATNIFYLQGTTDLGRPANTATITGGSVLEIFSNNTNTIFDKKFALNNGILNVGRAATLPGTISLTTATNTINANAATIASGVISGTGSLIKGGASTLTLSNANEYTGSTTVSAGTLSINSILNVNGGASPLGAPTNVLDGTISLGTSTGTGTLLYTGTGHTTDRVINLAGTSGGAALTQSGTGLLKLTSDFTATGNGGKTLTLQGSTAGTGEISGAIVNNGTVSAKTTGASFIAAATTITLTDVIGITIGSRITGTGLASNTLITAINFGTGVVTISPAATGPGALGQTMTVTAITTLTKAGTGTWTLSGNNTYSGITSLNAGMLVLGSTNALPGGIATTGGTGALSFNGGALGLASGDFTRSYGGITAGTIGRFDVLGNTGPWWAAYGADRIVNVGGAGASLTTYNGKPFNFGAADATNMLTYVNGVNMTTATRIANVYRGSTPGGIDARFSGNLTTTGANMAGWLIQGGGTIAFTGANTFAGRINVFAGTVIVNSLANTTLSSPIGNGTSGIGLAGGIFRYAAVAGSGGAGHSTNHNFTITASSSIDASGTGALVFNAPTGNIISPDLTTLGGTTTAASAVITGLSSTSNLAIGMRVTGAGIPAGRTIASIDNPTQVTLNSGTSVTAGAVTAFGTPTARTLTLTGTNTDANTIGGVLQDSSATGAGVLSIAKTGVGTWVLTGANTYTGTTAINGGILSVANISDIGTSNIGPSGAVSFNNGGTLLYTGAGASTTTRAFAASAGSGIINVSSPTGSLAISGTFTGSFTQTLTKSGAGTFILSGATDNGSLILNAAEGVVQLGKTSSAAIHTVAGISDIATGATVQITGTGGDHIFNGPFQTPFGLVNMSGGTLDLNGFNEGFDRLTGTGTVGNSLAATTSTLTLGTVNGSSSFAGSLTDGAGVLALTKIGSGTTTLTGVNTYSGNTAVSAGTLALADNAQLKFVIGATSGSSNSISGTGTLTIDGDFNIDTTLTDATALTSGTWVLVNAATLSETFSSTFTVVGAGWSETANVWTKTVGSKKYTFTEADGTLVLSSTASYATWIDGFFPGETNLAIIGADADPDKDGIENGVEMVIGGNPATGMDTALMPTIELVNADPDGDTTFADYLLFTYRRTDLSVNAGVTAECETDTDLIAPWTLATDVPGVVIIEDNNFTFTPPAANTDRVRVFVPKGANTKLFGRLNVEVP